MADAYRPQRTPTHVESDNVPAPSSKMSTKPSAGQMPRKGANAPGAKSITPRPPPPAAAVGPSTPSAAAGNTVLPRIPRRSDQAISNNNNTSNNGGGTLEITNNSSLAMALSPQAREVPALMLGAVTLQRPSFSSGRRGSGAADSESSPTTRSPESLPHELLLDGSSNTRMSNESSAKAAWCTPRSPHTSHLELLFAATQSGGGGDSSTRQMDSNEVRSATTPARLVSVEESLRTTDALYSIDFDKLVADNVKFLEVATTAMQHVERIQDDLPQLTSVADNTASVLAGLSDDIAALHTQHEREQDKLLTQLDQVFNQGTDEKIALVDAHDAETQALQLAHAHALAALRTSSQAEIDAVRADAQAERLTLTQQLQTLEQRKVDELDAMRNKHVDEHARLIEQHERELATLRAEVTSTAAAFHTKSENLRVQHEDDAARFASTATAEFANTVEAYERKLELAAASHASEQQRRAADASAAQAQLIERSDNVLALQREDAKRERERLALAHETEIGTLKRSHAELLERVTRAHGATAAQLRDAHTTRTLQLESAAREQKRQFSETLGSKDLELVAQALEATELRRQLAVLTQTHRALVSEHQQRVARSAMDTSERETRLLVVQQTLCDTVAALDATRRELRAVSDDRAVKGNTILELTFVVKSRDDEVERLRTALLASVKSVDQQTEILELTTETLSTKAQELEATKAALQKESGRLSRVEESMHHKDEILEDTEVKIDTMRLSMESLRLEMRRMQLDMTLQLEHSEAEMALKHGEISRLHAAQSELKQRADSYQHTIARLEETLAQTQRQVDDAQRRNHMLRLEATQLADTTKQTSDALLIATGDKQSAELERQRVQLQLTSLTVAVTKLQECRERELLLSEELQTRLLRVIADASADNSERVQTETHLLQRELATTRALVQQLEGVDTRLADAKRQVDAQCTQLERASGHARELDATVATLQALEVHYAAALRRIDELTTVAQHDDSDATQARIAALVATIDDQQHQLEQRVSADTTEERLQHELVVAQQLLEAQERDAADKRACLEDEVEALQRALLVCLDEVAALEAQASSAHTTCADYASRVEQLEQALRDASVATARDQEAINQTETVLRDQELAIYKEQLQVAQTALATYEEQGAALRQQLQQTEDALDESKQLVAARTATVDTVRRELQLLYDANSSSESSCASESNEPLLARVRQQLDAYLWTTWRVDRTQLDGTGCALATPDDVVACLIALFQIRCAALRTASRERPELRGSECQAASSSSRSMSEVLSVEDVCALLDRLELLQTTDPRARCQHVLAVLTAHDALLAHAAATAQEHNTVVITSLQDFAMLHDTVNDVLALARDVTQQHERFRTPEDLNSLVVELATLAASVDGAAVSVASASTSTRKACGPDESPATAAVLRYVHDMNVFVRACERALGLPSELPSDGASLTAAIVTSIEELMKLLHAFDGFQSTTASARSLTRSTTASTASSSSSSSSIQTRVAPMLTFLDELHLLTDFAHNIMEEESDATALDGDVSDTSNASSRASLRAFWLHARATTPTRSERPNGIDDTEDDRLVADDTSERLNDLELELEQPVDTGDEMNGASDHEGAGQHDLGMRSVDSVDSLRDDTICDSVGDESVETPADSTSLSPLLAESLVDISLVMSDHHRILSEAAHYVHKTARLRRHRSSSNHATKRRVPVDISTEICRLVREHCALLSLAKRLFALRDPLQDVTALLERFAVLQRFIGRLPILQHRALATSASTDGSCSNSASRDSLSSLSSSTHSLATASLSVFACLDDVTRHLQDYDNVLQHMHARSDPHALTGNATHMGGLTHGVTERLALVAHVQSRLGLEDVVEELPVVLESAQALVERTQCLDPWTTATESSQRGDASAQKPPTSSAASRTLERSESSDAVGIDLSDAQVDGRAYDQEPQLLSELVVDLRGADAYIQAFATIERDLAAYVDLVRWLRRELPFAEAVTSAATLRERITQVLAQLEHYANTSIALNDELVQQRSEIARLLTERAQSANEALARDWTAAASDNASNSLLMRLSESDADAQECAALERLGLAALLRCTDSAAATADKDVTAAASNRSPALASITFTDRLKLYERLAVLEEAKRIDCAAIASEKAFLAANQLALDDSLSFPAARLDVYRTLLDGQSALIEEKMARELESEKERAFRTAHNIVASSTGSSHLDVLYQFVQLRQQLADRKEADAMERAFLQTNGLWRVELPEDEAQMDAQEQFGVRIQVFSELLETQAQVERMRQEQAVASESQQLPVALPACEDALLRSNGLGDALDAVDATDSDVVALAATATRMRVYNELLVRIMRRDATIAELQQAHNDSAVALAALQHKVETNAAEHEQEKRTPLTTIDACAAQLQQAQDAFVCDHATEEARHAQVITAAAQQHADELLRQQQELNAQLEAVRAASKLEITTALEKQAKQLEFLVLVRLNEERLAGAGAADKSDASAPRQRRVSTALSPAQVRALLLDKVTKRDSLAISRIYRSIRLATDILSCTSATTAASASMTTASETPVEVTQAVLNCVKELKALKEFLIDSLEQITRSDDANASLPRFKRASDAAAAAIGDKDAAIDLVLCSHREFMASAHTQLLQREDAMDAMLTQLLATLRAIAAGTSQANDDGRTLIDAAPAPAFTLDERRAMELEMTSTREREVRANAECKLRLDDEYMTRLLDERKDVEAALTAALTELRDECKALRNKVDVLEQERYAHHPHGAAAASSNSSSALYSLSPRTVPPPPSYNVSSSNASASGIVVPMRPEKPRAPSPLMSSSRAMKSVAGVAGVSATAANSVHKERFVSDLERETGQRRSANVAPRRPNEWKPSDALLSSSSNAPSSQLERDFRALDHSVPPSAFRPIPSTAAAFGRAEQELDTSTPSSYQQQHAQDQELWYQGVRTVHYVSFFVSIFYVPKQRMFRIEVFNSDTEQQQQTVYVPTSDLQTFVDESTRAARTGLAFTSLDDPTRRTDVVDVLFDRVRVYGEGSANVMLGFE